jgi:hypothetical protein
MERWLIQEWPHSIPLGPQWVAFPPFTPIGVQWPGIHFFDSREEAEEFVREWDAAAM